MATQCWRHSVVLQTIWHLKSWRQLAWVPTRKQLIAGVWEWYSLYGEYSWLKIYWFLFDRLCCRNIDAIRCRLYVTRHHQISYKKIWFLAPCCCLRLLNMLSYICQHLLLLHFYFDHMKAHAVCAQKEHWICFAVFLVIRHSAMIEMTNLWMSRFSRVTISTTWKNHSGKQSQTMVSNNRMVSRLMMRVWLMSLVFMLVMATQGEASLV